MRRIAGLIMFFVGVGMTIMLFLPVNFWSILLTLLFLIVGYNLFASDRRGHC